MNPERLLALYDRIADAPDAVGRLRRFVLDLAVRGKLVPQDPQDEPATELLKQISAERTRHGLNAVTKPLPDSEAPFSIPTGWAWTRIGEITTKTGSGSTPRGGKEVYADSGVPFLRSQNVYDDGLRLNDVAFITLDVHERMSGTAVKPGDLLLNITGGSIGRCCCVPSDFGDANISQHVAIIRLAIGDLADFVHKLILSPYFQAFIFGEQTGAGRGGLPKNRMDKIPVALPPLAEQRRIVAKVDELMALCDRLEEARKLREESRDRLAAASLARLNTPDPDPTAFTSDARFALGNLSALTTRPDQIKQLRQTILNLAVRGKLVPQDPQDEPVSNLIKRIQKDIAEYEKVASVRPMKPDAIEPDEVPFTPPAGWQWRRLCELFRVVTDGDHQPPPRADEGVAFLTIGNVTTGKLDFSDCRLVPRSYFEGLPAYRTPRQGDILYTVVGATFGRAVFVNAEREFCVQRHIAILKPSNQMDVRYLLHLLASPLIYEQASRSTTGTAQPTIALRPLRNFYAPLPPLAEQRRIVAKIDHLMALCDCLEAGLSTAADTRRKLLDALLAEALEPAMDTLEAAE